MNSTIKRYTRNAYLRMHRKSACVETFKSLYEKWLPTRFGIVSKSAIESYRIAYDHIQSIANCLYLLNTGYCLRAVKLRQTTKLTIIHLLI